jgi:alpha-glucosidase
MKPHERRTMNDSQPLALTKPLWLGGVTIFAGLSLLGCATSEGHPALQFLLDVPVDWEETRVLHGEIGEFLTMVRKDRNSRDWYLGSITNESPRALETDCAFLEEGVDYVAEIYADGADADWETNPQAFETSRREVTRGTKLHLRLAPGGGQAIRFRALGPRTERGES